MVDEIHMPTAGVDFEGAGDCLWDPGAADVLGPAGASARSSPAAAADVARVFGVGKEVVTSLELVDPRFYHLDVSLRPLERGHILYHPQAFSTAGQRDIAARAGAENLIPVSDEDAAHFAVNAVTFGDHVIMSSASDALRAALDEHCRLSRAPDAAVGRSTAAAARPSA